MTRNEWIMYNNVSVFPPLYLNSFYATELKCQVPTLSEFWGRVKNDILQMINSWRKYMWIYQYATKKQNSLQFIYFSCEGGSVATPASNTVYSHRYPDSIMCAHTRTHREKGNRETCACAEGKMLLSRPKEKIGIVEIHTFVPKEEEGKKHSQISVNMALTLVREPENSFKK